MLNEEQVTILTRARNRLIIMSEIADKRKADREAKEMFEEAAIINLVINKKVSGYEQS